MLALSASGKTESRFLEAGLLCMAVRRRFDNRNSPQSWEQPGGGWCL